MVRFINIINDDKTKKFSKSIIISKDFKILEMSYNLKKEPFKMNGSKVNSIINISSAK